MEKSKEFKEMRGKISVNLRILFDYVQMVSITQNVKFQWPIYLKQYFNFFSYLSFTTQIFSLDCVLEGYEVDFLPLFFKSLITEVLPFASAILACFYFSFRIFSGKKKEKEEIITKIIVVVFIVFTYSQSSIIFQLLQMVSCIEINGVEYLSSDVSYICYNSKHNKWVIIIIILD